MIWYVTSDLVLRCLPMAHKTNAKLTGHLIEFAQVDKLFKKNVIHSIKYVDLSTLVESKWSQSWIKAL